MFKLFGNNSPLRDDDDLSGGGGAVLDPRIRAEIGRQLNALMKKEVAPRIGETVTNFFKSDDFRNQLAGLGTANAAPLTPGVAGGNFGNQGGGEGEVTPEEFNYLVNELGYDPQTDAFFTPEGLPYDPESGQVFFPVEDPQTGEVVPIPIEEAQAAGLLDDGPEGYNDPYQDPYQRMDPRLNGEVYDLRRQNAMLQAQVNEILSREEEMARQAESIDRQSQINQMLSNVQFVNDKAMSQFRTYLDNSLFRLDDGTLVAGDLNSPLPPDKWIEAELNASPHLLQARPMGGSGAFQGTGVRLKAPTMDQIKPGMDPKERQEIAQYASSLVAGTMNLTPAPGKPIV